MPRIRDLPNKPLVEALCEIRWKLSPDQGDAHYPVFIGALYERVKSEYPFHEALPTSIIPQPAIPYLVQHRFRTGSGRWPLIQVGPGVVTLNHTEAYAWQDFGNRAKSLIDQIFSAYPAPEKLDVNFLHLRYIDAVQINYDEEDAFVFLREKLKTAIALSPKLFEGVSVRQRPRAFNFQVTFPVDAPRGLITIRFGTGTHRDKSALLWETAVQSTGADVPRMPEAFAAWIESAHQLTDDWFFKLIEGELERRFAGEE